MEITVLGSGTSTGVPSVGCQCKVCTSHDPHDNRLRCSGLVDIDGVRILIDCGPDFRQQMLRLNEFRPIDGVLITHEHYDHVGGLDDLRPFCQFKDIPVYAEDFTAERLMKRMPYCFAQNPYPGIPHIILNKVAPARPFHITGSNGRTIEVMPIRVIHGKMPILGFRIANVAWITDMLTMPEATYPYLEGLDTLFINALRITTHWTHQSLDEALAQIQRIRPRRACLIHMSHQIGLHAEVQKSLPENVILTYDGMKLSV